MHVGRDADILNDVATAVALKVDFHLGELGTWRVSFFFIMYKLSFDQFFSI